MKSPILIISPIPSHPQQQGNSARIYRLAKLFQLKGHPIHFIYFGLEGMTKKQEASMCMCWDFFHYLQPNGPAPGPSLPDYYHIDDWYDSRVSTLVERLCAQWGYTACVVNYVWFSKALEFVPEGVTKIIDTHDIFGDRHLIARESGLEPVWFYTSKELEALALRRADVVLAIQDEESHYFKNIFEGDVFTVGYVIPSIHLPNCGTRKQNVVKIGYLGSGNPFNVISVLSFFDSINPSIYQSKEIEFHIAGSICEVLSSRVNHNVKLLGIIENADDFYTDMDVLINPMVGGTGLKIKSVEALSYGKPLLATSDAMVGICSSCEAGVFDTVKQLANFIRIGQAYEGVSQKVWTEYVSKNINSFERLCLKYLQD